MIPVIDAGGSPSPTVSIGTSESLGRERSVAAAADDGRARRGRRTPSPAAAETSTSPAFGLRSAAAARAAAVRILVEEREVLVAVAAGHHLAVLEEERDVDRRLAVERLGEAPRIVAVEHRGAVGGGDESAVDRQARRLLDARLAVVGAEHDARSGRGTRRARPPPRTARRSAASARASASCAASGPERMRGVVVVREVVDEQVEAVARDEPAADRGGVGVDRAERAVAPGDRGARSVGLVDAVEEEPLRPVDGREARDRGQMPVPATVGRDVDRRGRQPRPLERLEDRLGAAREMALVEVDDRVAEALDEPGRAHRGERRAVLDEALLLAVPPDEVRDPVHVGVRRRSRSRPGTPASATGRSRPRGGSVPWSSRKRSAGASVASSIDGVRPSITIRTTGLGLVTCEGAKPGVPLGLSAAEPQPERRQGDRLEVADHRDEGERGGEQRREADEHRQAEPGPASPERPGDDRAPRRTRRRARR